MFFNQKIKDLLSEIFKSNLSRSSKVNYKKFRVDHREHRDLLTYLETHNYLKVTEEDTYTLSVFGLCELEEDLIEIKELIDELDSIYQVFRSHYEKHQDKPLLLNQLSKQARIPIQKVEILLAYLVDIKLWWRGHGLDTNNENPHVQIAESILDYDSFRELLYKAAYMKRERRKDEGNAPDPGYLVQIPSYKQELMNSFQTTISKPSWHDSLPNEINELLYEVYYGLEKEMSVLPSIGLRTIIDLICNNKIGDVGGFADKLSKLVEEGFITDRKKDIISQVLEVGHASAHRGYFPTFEKLEVVLEIVNHLLKEIYILENTSSQIGKDVPIREK